MRTRGELGLLSARRVDGEIDKEGGCQEKQVEQKRGAGVQRDREQERADIEKEVDDETECCVGLE